MVGTADDGTTVMVIAHTHGHGTTILHETEPGVFEPGDGPVPKPDGIGVIALSTQRELRPSGDCRDLVIAGTADRGSYGGNPRRTQLMEWP